MVFEMSEDVELGITLPDKMITPCRMNRYPILHHHQAARHSSQHPQH